MRRTLYLLIILMASAFSQTCKPRRETSSVQGAGLSANVSLYNPGNRSVSWEGKDRFLGTVQPILASRCVACHGCTDAPCSAKFTNYEYLARGASWANPYAPHAFEGDFLDQKNPPNFYSTLGKTYNDSLMVQFVKLGAKNTTDQDPGGAFDTTILDPMRKTYLARRNYQCPANANFFASYSAANPMAGMPFGLPHLSQSESRDLLTWIAETGGKGPDAVNAALLSTPSNTNVVNAWDKFLNQSAGNIASRSALVSRYLYEHLFHAHIAFKEMPGEFFQLVRSFDPPGPQWTNPGEIITQLPTDDPNTGGKPFYYRMKKITEVITQKNHVVIELSQDKIEDYEKLFFTSKWDVTAQKLPGYTTNSPFENFKDIPEDIRYRFMLENSHYIVDNMVRSPVCVGESATYAIADHFWVFFLKPSSDPSSGAKVKMSKDGFDHLTLDVKAWTAVGQIKDRFKNNYIYQSSFEDALRADLAARGKTGLDLDDLWQGEPLRDGGVSHNRNAWLSITRHDISTTVQYGVKGGNPQSLWLFSYANFERLYYNLVVNFKYWGGGAHKLGTWRNMSHERMDGEDLWLSLLPATARNRIREIWSGGLEIGEDLKGLTAYIAPTIKLITGIDIGSQEVNRYIDLYPLQSLRAYPSNDPVPGPRTGVKDLQTYQGDRAYDVVINLTRKIRDRMVSAQVSAANDPLNAQEDGETIYTPNIGSSASKSLPEIRDFASFEKALALVGEDRGQGRYAAWLPATTIVRVTAPSGDARVYSFVGNRGYKSHNLWALASSDETKSPVRDVTRDTVSIYSGVVGDRPDLFFDIPLIDQKKGDSLIGATQFFKLVDQMNSDNYLSVYAKLKADYAVLRNSSKFWPFYDWLHQWMISHDGDSGPGIVYAGILDLQNYDPPRNK